jgi:cysteine desulfurase
MKEQIYLDYQASVPTRPEVIEIVGTALTELGNPNSTHAFGRKAAASVLTAKDILGDFLHVSPRDIVFTSGATESIELALLGVVEAVTSQHSSRVWNVVTTPVEHSAVLDTLSYLSQKFSLEVRYVDVDEFGQISLESFEDLLDENTLMVSVMYANNEIGTVYPLRKIGKIIGKFRESCRSIYPIFHSDATQAPLYLDMDVSYLGVDMLTISAHKIGGPIGIGALYVSSDTPIVRVRPGKGEEGGLKSGTISPALVAGFARAIQCISHEKKERIIFLQKYLCEKLERVEGIVLNGPSIGDKRLPCNIHISTGVPSDEMMMRLDMAGIGVSAGSACHSRAIEPSHVIQAITDDVKRIHSALRISIGYKTTESELDFLVKILSNSIT